MKAFLMKVLLKKNGALGKWGHFYFFNCILMEKIEVTRFSNKIEVTLFFSESMSNAG